MLRPAANDMRHFRSTTELEAFPAMSACGGRSLASWRAAGQANGLRRRDRLRIDGGAFDRSDLLLARLPNMVWALGLKRLETQ